jgi:membrane protease YdiL (CAAX protease family)
MDPAETLCDNDGQLVPRRGAVLAVAVATSVVVYLPLYLSVIFGGWRIAGALITCGLMGTIPFVLARATPRAANFDTPWFPLARSHWLWFLGMVFILFVCKVITAMLLYPLGTRHDPSPEIPTAGSVILVGITLIVLGPIAEEIFWLGYFLEQLRKLTPSAVAILIQSLLFGLTHLHLHFGYFASIQAFLIGAVLGMWRIRFQSLLPLILAHMIFNGVVCVPRLTEQYRVAKLAEPIADSLAEYARNVRSNPKCRQIAALTRGPAQEAVPAIVDYFADPDEDVRTYAMTVLGGCFRREAEPYLKKPLSSRDKNTLDSALFVVGICRYSVYKQEVRDIAWSADDVVIQLSAVSTLRDFNDEEGLRGIARSHPKARVRESAERLLAWSSNPTAADSSPPAERPERAAKSAPSSR